MSASCSSMRFGEKSGSINLRYLECFGGSMLSGMSGRTLPSGMSMCDENSSWWRNTKSLSSRLNTMTMPSAGAAMPPCSIMSRYDGCGDARFSSVSIVIWA